MINSRGLWSRLCDDWGRFCAGGRHRRHEVVVTIVFHLLGGVHSDARRKKDNAALHDDVRLFEHD